MNTPINDWRKIRAHYADWYELIMASPANEWAGGAYDWDIGMLFMTPIENWLWADIRACDAVLYPQFPIFNFFVDYANPRAKVVIECDGEAYHQDKVKDAARDKRLTDAGWSVYRISGRHCRMECDPETGAPSIPHLFIQRICDRHGISRNSQVRSDQDDDWAGPESMSKWLDELLARAKGGRL